MGQYSDNWNQVYLPLSFLLFWILANVISFCHCHCPEDLPAFCSNSHGIHTYSSMKHSVTLPKVSVVAAYLSQDQYQKRVESMSRLSPHAPESMTKQRAWKYGFKLTCTQPSYGLSLDFELNELVSTTTEADNHTSEISRNICVISRCELQGV